MNFTHRALGDCQEQRNMLAQLLQQSQTEPYMHDSANYRRAHARAYSTDTYTYADTLPPAPVTIRDKLRAEIKEWCGGILERY